MVLENCKHEQRNDLGNEILDQPLGKNGLSFEKIRNVHFEVLYVELVILGAPPLADRTDLQRVQIHGDLQRYEFGKRSTLGK